MYSREHIYIPRMWEPHVWSWDKEIKEMELGCMTDVVPQAWTLVHGQLGQTK